MIFDLTYYRVTRTHIEVRCIQSTSEKKDEFDRKINSFRQFADTDSFKREIETERYNATAISIKQDMIDSSAFKRMIKKLSDNNPQDLSNFWAVVSEDNRKLSQERSSLIGIKRHNPEDKMIDLRMNCLNSTYGVVVAVLTPDIQKINEQERIHQERQRALQAEADAREAAYQRRLQFEKEEKEAEIRKYQQLQAEKQQEEENMMQLMELPTPQSQFYYPQSGFYQTPQQQQMTFFPPAPPTQFPSYYQAAWNMPQPSTKGFQTYR